MSKAGPAPCLEVRRQGRITHLGPVGCGQAGQGGQPGAGGRRYAAGAEAMGPGASGLGLPIGGGLSGPSPAGRPGSWALENRAGACWRGSFPLGFKLACTARTCAIASGRGSATGLELPIGERVAAIEERPDRGRHGDEWTCSALIRWFKGVERGLVSHHPHPLGGA